MADLETAPVLEAKLQQSKPASLPPRPQREEDLLDQFKRQATAIKGSAPTKEQTEHYFDDYARMAIREVATADRVSLKFEKLMNSFSERSLREVYKSDPVLAMQMRKTKEAKDSTIQLIHEAVEQHGSLEAAGRAEGRERNLGGLVKSYRDFKDGIDSGMDPLAIVAARRKTLAQWKQLIELAQVTPAEKAR